MTRILALFVATSSTAALAQPVVSYEDSGNGGATVLIENITPNGSFVVQVGEHLFPATIPTGACAGTQSLIDTADSSYQRRILTANANGAAKFTIPAGFAPYGKEIQVLDNTTCAITWPVTIGMDECNAPLTFIETEADIDAIENCRQLPAIQAGLDINGNALDVLSLPNLEAVRTFDSTYAAADFPTLELDELTFIGDLTAEVSGALDLPSVVHATKLAIQGDAQLISMRSLETIGESLSVVGMPSLKFINMPNLLEIGNGLAPFNLSPAGNTAVVITDNDRLGNINFGSLEYANRLLVRDNPA